MSKKLLAVAVLALVILAGAVLWMSQKSPLDDLTEDTGYAYTDIAVYNDETNAQVTDLGEEFSLFAGAIIDIGNQFAELINAGYLLVDPATKTATLVALGQPLTAPLPTSRREVAFDVTGTGSEPVFLAYGADTDTFTTRMPVDSIFDGYSIRVTFNRLAPEDLATRIETQNALQQETAGARADWAATLDALPLDAALPTLDPSTSYRRRLPTDLGYITLPIDVLNLIPATNESFAATNGRTPDDPANVMFEIYLFETEVAENRLNSLRREWFPQNGDPDGRILFDNGNDFLISNRGDPYLFVQTHFLGQYGFEIQARSDDFNEIQQVRAVSASISETADITATLPDDLDAQTWWSERINNLTVAETFGDTIEGEVTETITPVVAPSSIMRTRNVRQIAVEVEDGEDAFETYEHLRLGCTARLASDAPITDVHDALYDHNHPFSLSNRSEGTEFYVVAIAFEGPYSEFVYDRMTPLDIAPPTWLGTTATSPIENFGPVTLGTDTRQFFAYTSRTIGPIDLICAATGQHPYAPLLALNALASADFSAAENIPPFALETFGQFAEALTDYDGLIFVANEEDGPEAIFTPDGTQLTDFVIDFDFPYRDSGGFRADHINGKEGFFNMQGEQLLAFEYDDIDDLSSPHAGILELEKGDETTFYSVTNRAFVDDPRN